MLVREKENPVAGYMGFIPSKEEKDLSQGHHFDFHIPGYVGYIPSIKAQNLYAHTYGKITEECAKKNYFQGVEHPPNIKYKSTTKETYVDPIQIKNQESQNGKINGVKLSTFSNAAKLMMKKSERKQIKPLTNMTYEEACLKSYR